MRKNYPKLVFWRLGFPRSRPLCPLFSHSKIIALFPDFHPNRPIRTKGKAEARSGNIERFDPNMIFDNDLIALIFNGVGPVYEDTVNYIQEQDTTICLADLVGLLQSVKNAS